MATPMTRRADIQPLPGVERDNSGDGPMTLERLTALERLTSFAAHEIRNPLAAFRAIAQLAITVEDPVRRDALLRELVDSIDNLSTFLTELLALSGSKRSMLVPIDVRPVIAGVVRLFSVQADVLRIRLRVNVSRDLPHVWGNGPLLRHAFINLVKNAVEAMPDGGTITIRARRLTGRDSVCVAVKDTGNGIPEAYHERLFHGLGEGRGGGAGVGLPFVHRVITDVHDGRLRFETKPGVGTTFYVELSPVSATGADNGMQ